MRRIPGEGRQWLAAIALGAAFFALPFLLIFLEAIGHVKWSAWLAIAVLLIVLMLKVAYAPLISGRFSYARQGNDLCLASLSGSIGVFALQLDQATDLLPGGRRLLKDLDFLPAHTAVAQNLVIIATLGAVSLAAFVLTAHQIAQIRGNERSGWAPVRGVACYFMGMLCVLAYVVLLVIK